MVVYIFIANNQFPTETKKGDVQDSVENAEEYDKDKILKKLLELIPLIMPKVEGFIVRPL